MMHISTSNFKATCNHAGVMGSFVLYYYAFYDFRLFLHQFFSPYEVAEMNLSI